MWLVDWPWTGIDIVPHAQFAHVESISAFSDSRHRWHSGSSTMSNLLLELSLPATPPPPCPVDYIYYMFRQGSAMPRFRDGMQLLPHHTDSTAAGRSSREDRRWSCS